MTLKHDLRAVAAQFEMWGQFRSAESYGSGHINDTYCVVFDQAGTTTRYIIQRINHNIFKQPVALMENIQRVTTHLASKMKGKPDFSRRVLTLIPTREGLPYFQDAEGNFWRAYLFIERARSYDAVESPRQEIGRAH